MKRQNRIERVRVSVTPRELEKYKRGSEALGMKLSEFARASMDKHIFQCRQPSLPVHKKVSIAAKIKRKSLLVVICEHILNRK
tara:strand:- start:187 stop:435 length:249 start_codon:yes stop_codon:yes gene_type:complete